MRQVLSERRRLSPVVAVVAVLLCVVAIGGPRAWAFCWPQEWQKILAADGATDDRFGEAVAISGDVVLIGAAENGETGARSGSAYVFRRTGPTWVQEAKLVPDDNAPDDYFGLAVAICEDVAVIGALGHGEAGCAYVYRFSGSEWIEEVQLVASDGGGPLGNAVSISGDVALVGASYDNHEGSVYVFRFNGSAWDEEAKLVAPDPSYNQYFGCSVSISGDTAVIGASGDHGQTGAAYAFRRDGLSWLYEAKLLAPDGEADDRFGCSVSISGDTGVIGAMFDDDHGYKAGSAYVFRYAGAEWAQEAKLFGEGAHETDYFGGSVSLSGEVIVVGAEGQNSFQGRAHVFRPIGSFWVQEALLRASDTEFGDMFGTAVAISDDTCVIGAHGNDDNGSLSGSAYIFHGLSDYDDNGTIDICDIDFNGPVEVETIGEPTDVVSIDFTGDSANDIAIAELGATPTDLGYLVLLLNDGSGLDFTKMSTAVGHEPSAFAVADFDGINGPDAAVCNSADDTVTILLNDGEGNGTFEPGVDVTVGEFPSDIAAGDFDGDDDIDLAVTNKNDNNVQILTNDGTGTFSQGGTFNVGNAPSAILAADFNHDDLIDLAVANEADDNVMIFLNTGPRGFELHATIPVGLDPGVLEPEDLDDDQNIDMAVGNRGSDKLTLLINDGAANFETMTLTVGDDPASIAIADVDVDGDEDILVVADTPDSRAVRVLRNDLNGGEELSFTLFTDLAEDPNLKLTAAKDLNGNHLPDVIAVNGPADGGSAAAGGRQEGSVRVLLNRLVICPGDLDGDWDVDTADLLYLLGAWGTPDGDVDFDGDTDTADLLALLAAWGDCP